MCVCVCVCVCGVCVCVVCVCVCVFTCLSYGVHVLTHNISWFVFFSHLGSETIVQVIE